MNIVKRILVKLRNGVINTAGALVGIAGLFGFKYPVKKYRHKVSDALWRGSRLDAKAIADLHEEGFRLIVNLCAENDNDAFPAAYHGIKTIHIKIIDNTPPRRQQMLDFVNAVQTPDNQPAYVHCQAGKGRTGCAVASYRILVQGWTAADAIREADEFGLGMPSQRKFIQRLYDDWASGVIIVKDGIITVNKNP